jgi:hypothetical protein
MLEHGALLLRPCDAPGNGAASDLRPLRTVCDADTGRLLGVAGWRRAGRSWLRWLYRPVLAVHEADDAPLLFTVHRLWGLAPGWEVQDADGHVLGLLYGPHVKDRFGRNLAVGKRGPGGRLTRVCGGDGRELMSIAVLAEGSRLTFAAEVEANPFLKMLLLALALVHEGKVPTGCFKGTVPG